MSAGHVPGSWGIIDPDDHQINVGGEWDDDGLVVSQSVVIGSQDRRIAIVVCDMNVRNHWDDKKLNAAASLLIASPDLLGLARKIVGAIDPACMVESDHPQAPMSDILIEAHNVIREATGAKS